MPFARFKPMNYVKYFIVQLQLNQMSADFTDFGPLYDNNCLLLQRAYVFVFITWV